MRFTGSPYEALATAAATQAGLDVNWEAAYYGSDGHHDRIAAPSNDRLHDIYFEVCPTSVTHEMLWSRVETFFPLRSLFQQTSYTVRTTEPLFDGRKVEIEVWDSPEGINAAQYSLGRQPGHDALAMVRLPGVTRYTYGEATLAYAHKHILASDLSNWVFARHDTTIPDHVQSWLLTSPEICNRAAVYAGNLCDTYSSDIDDPMHRPAAVEKFGSAVDRWQEFTGGLLDRVMYYTGEKRADETTFRRVAEAMNPGVTRTSLPGLSLREKIVMDMGIVDTQATGTEMLAEFQKVVADSIHHTAELSLRLDDISAPEDDTATTRRNRQDFWGKLLKLYPVLT